MFQLDSVFYQRSFKGKRAANQKGHHVLAPVPGRICYRVHELAVFEDAVARNIGADIALGQKGRGILSCFQDPDDGTGLGIALRKKQEVKGVFLRHGQQVRLHKASRIA